MRDDCRRKRRDGKKRMTKMKRCTGGRNEVKVRRTDDGEVHDPEF